MQLLMSKHTTRWCHFLANFLVQIWNINHHFPNPSFLLVFGFYNYNLQAPPSILFSFLRLSFTQVLLLFLSFCFFVAFLSISEHFFISCFAVNFIFYGNSPFMKLNIWTRNMRKTFLTRVKCLWEYYTLQPSS